MSKIRPSSPLSGLPSVQAVHPAKPPHKKDDTNLLKKVLIRQAYASGLSKDPLFNWRGLSDDDKKSTWFELIKNYTNDENEENFKKIITILKKYNIDELNEDNHPINWKDGESQSALDLAEAQNADSDLCKLLLHYDRMACLQNLIGEYPQYNFTKFKENLDQERNQKEALNDLEALLSQIKEVFETEESKKNIINKLIEFFYSSKITEAFKIEDCDGFLQEKVDMLKILSLDEDDDFYENPVKIVQNQFIYAAVLHWIENEKNEIQSCETSPSSSPFDSDAESLNGELNAIFK